MKSNHPFKEERIAAKRRRIRELEQLQEKLYHERFEVARQDKQEVKLEHLHAE